MVTDKCLECGGRNPNSFIRIRTRKERKSTYMQDDDDIINNEFRLNANFNFVDFDVERGALDISKGFTSKSDSDIIGIFMSFRCSNCLDINKIPLEIASVETCKCGSTVGHYSGMPHYCKDEKIEMIDFEEDNIVTYLECVYCGDNSLKIIFEESDKDFEEYFEEYQNSRKSFVDWFIDLLNN